MSDEARTSQPKHLFGDYYYWFSTLPGICYGCIHTITTKSERYRTRDNRVQFERVLPFLYKRVTPQGVWLDIGERT